jgi:hypothetical protein
MKRLVLVVFFFEVGLVLAVAPWSAYWDQNYFAASIPGLRALLSNDFIRGGVSGLGLVNFAAGIAEFLSIAGARRYRESIVTIGSPSAHGRDHPPVRAEE